MRDLFNELRNELDLRNRCDDFFDISFEAFSSDGSGTVEKQTLNLFDYIEKYYSHDETGLNAYTGPYIYKIRLSEEKAFVPLPATEKELIMNIANSLQVDFPWWVLAPGASRYHLDIVLYVLCCMQIEELRWLEEIFKYYGSQKESFESMEVLQDVIATVTLSSGIKEEEKKHLLGLLGYTHKCVFIDWFREKKKNRGKSAISDLIAYSKVFEAGKTMGFFIDRPLILWRKAPQGVTRRELQVTRENYEVQKGCRIVLFDAQDKLLPYFDDITYQMWLNEQSRCAELDRILDRRERVESFKLIFVYIPFLIFMFAELIKAFPVFFGMLFVGIIGGAIWALFDKFVYWCIK